MHCALLLLLLSLQPGLQPQGDQIQEGPPTSEGNLMPNTELNEQIDRLNTSLLQEEQRREQHREAVLKVQTMITKMRDIRTSRARAVGQFHQLSGFVYSRFKSFNPGEMSDAYFSQHFRQPFIQLERIVGQIKQFKIVCGEMTEEISEAF